MTFEKLKNLIQGSGDIGTAVVLGFIGGAICGAIVLSFGALVGRSGSTGTEYLGYWDAGLVFLGFLDGGLLGAIVAPLAYSTHVKDIGFRSAILPASIGTILGGCIGALVGPPVAVVTGTLGFFLALVRIKQAAARRSHW